MNLSDILFIKKKISILNQNNSSSFSPSKSNDFLFIIPGPSAPGSGGHNTLSMFINFLSKNIENSIYIFYYRCCFKTVEEQHEMFVNGYSLKKEIKAININDLSSFYFKAVFYTDHLSWFLTDVISSKKNFVFLQDWEQLFEAAGWQSVFSEYNLQNFDVYICASAWLKQMIKNLFKNSANKKIYSFELGIESKLSNIESMKKNKNKRKSISAYVRTETPRRCWEIVREVYRELISDDTLDFDLGLFGMNCDELINQSNFSKNVRNDGLISKSQLPKYFLNNDLIIAFSATNYNLILWDCVSIGTPVIDLDIGPLKHLNHPLILKTSPYPDDIIKNIKKAININYEKPKIPFLNSLLWDSRFSDLWEKLKIEF